MAGPSTNRLHLWRKIHIQRRGGKVAAGREGGKRGAGAWILNRTLCSLFMRNRRATLMDKARDRHTGQASGVGGGGVKLGEDK